MQDVVGGMGHQVAGLGPVKIGRRQGLDMEKESVPYPLLYPPRGPDQAPAPDKAKYTDQQGYTDYIEGITKELCGCDATDCEVINSPFDDARDKELKDVNYKQGEKAEKDYLFMAL